jgi:hypothetical protein
MGRVRRPGERVVFSCCLLPSALRSRGVRAHAPVVITGRFDVDAEARSMTTIVTAPGSAALAGVEVATRRVLVTGCGRCGTTYASLLLSRAGLHVPHERKVGRDGISSWLFAPGSVAVPWGPVPARYRFEHVVHLVRDPLAAIPSLATFRSSAWQYIALHAPIDPTERVLLRAARFWLHWNALVERRATLRVRIEDMPGALGGVLAHVGASDAAARVEREPLRRDLNTRRHGRLFASFETRCLRLGIVPGFAKALLSRLRPRYQDVTWADLRALDEPLADALHAKAVEYGYRYATDVHA